MRYRIVLSILLFLLYTTAGKATSNSPEIVKAINMVTNLYNGLKTISIERQGSKVSQIKMDLQENFFAEKGQNAPNEFKYLGRQNDFNVDVSVRRYILEFNEMFLDDQYRDYSFYFEVQKGNSFLLTGPQFKKGEAPASFAQIVVRKSYRKGNKVLRVFTDTLQLDLERMRICDWANEVSTNHIGVHGSSLVTVEQLRLDAALAYEKRQYTEAYRIYNQIVNQHPKEGDPYYRMAIMLYKKLAGFDLSKKKRQKLILQYLDKAKECGNYKTKECADNMHYWITC